VPDLQRSREWRPWVLLAGTLVIGLLLAVSKVRPLVLVGVVVVLSCVFILVRMVADRRRTRR
jgi:dolichyl-phosphate-mannose--protein O-mannosyl transferase